MLRKKPAKKRRKKSVEDGQEFSVYDGMRKLGDIATKGGRYRAAIDGRHIGAFRKLPEAARAIGKRAHG